MSDFMLCTACKTWRKTVTTTKTVTCETCKTILALPYHPSLNKHERRERIQTEIKARLQSSPIASRVDAANNDTRGSKKATKDRTRKSERKLKDNKKIKKGIRGKTTNLPKKRPSK